MRRLTSLLLALIAVGTLCIHAKADRNKGGGARRTKVITLERGPCFGACPVYKLAIFSDGTVTYEGIRFVKKLGLTNGRISRGKLLQLVKDFQRIDYFDLPASFTPGTKECEHYATDMPSAITSLSWRGRSKTINHYHGCSGSDALEKLTDLENKIDKVVGVTKWTK